MSTLRRLVFGNLMRTLAIALGVMQAGIAHWLWVVLAGGEAPSPTLILALALALAALNVAAMPTLRRARRQRGASGEPGERGFARRAAGLYLSVGLTTLLLGAAVAVSWLVLWPASWLAGSASGDPLLSLGLFRGGSVTVVSGVALLVAWGFSGGQARVDHAHVPLDVAGLAPEHGGLRIAHLSDLHIGNGHVGESLAALVARVNALDADLIVLTGDLFDFDPSVVDHGAAMLSKLRAPLGVYAVLGNHDLYVGAERVADAFARHAPDLRLLRGELVALPVEPPLYIAGVDDPGLAIAWTDREVHLDELDRLAEARPHDGPVLLLVHRPEAFPQAAHLGFEVVLAGHTHGGQLALPGTGGRVNFARLISRFDRGHHRQGDSQLYVSRGIGVAGPAIRIACDRELPLIELRCGAHASDN